VKKLLTALCLCLALCLLCGAAMADEPVEEAAREYTRFECVNGVPGVMRCFYGKDDAGNDLYDDRPMTAEELKDDQYHLYGEWTWVNGQHAKKADGEYEVTAPASRTRKCERCGNEDTVVLEDDWWHEPVKDSWVETPATCVDPERISYVCAICGDTIVDEFGDPDAMNHSWIQAMDEDGKPIITKATCEKSGEKTLECEYCKATKKMEIAPREHQLSDEVTYKWDFKKGTVSAVKACLNTEATDEYEACKYVEIVETVKATGKLVDEKDCTKGKDWESEEFKTEGLEKQTTHEELKHQFGAPVFTWGKDYATAEAKHVCSVCGTEESESVDTVKTLKKDTLCTAADKVTYTATFTAQWVTDWAKKNADAYKAATVKTMAGEHSYEQVGAIEWSKDNSKATLEYKCTEETCPHSKQDAKTGKYQTKTINTVRTEDTTVPCDDEKRVEWKADFSSMFKDLVETKNGSLEHEWDKPVIEKQGKDCDDENVMVKWCKHCRLTSVTYPEPVAPVYSDKADKTITKKIANEKADGSYCYEEETTEIFYCINCGGFHKDYTEYPEHIKNVVTSRLVKEHDFELQEDDENAATCTEGGTLTYVCKECGYVKTEEVDALGHTWGEWKLVHKTGENGNELAYWTRSCEVCGEIDPLIIEKNELTCEDLKEEHTYAWGILEGEHVYQCTKCGVVENKEIPDDVHVWSEEPEIIEATCLVDGKKVWTCEICGKTKEEAIKAAGKHTPGKEQIVTAATCEADGLIAITCTKCSEVLETKTIPATGHTAGDPVITAATCTEAGKEEIKCSVCGEVISSNEIPALGHKEVKDEGAEATCTEAGKTEGSHCEVCGEVIKAQEEIPALGHDWDEGEITKEASAEGDGEKTYTCKVCGETKTEVIPFVLGETPVYTLSGMSYGANKITGTAVHDPSTVESPKLYARVTVFFVGGTYAVFADYVEDGVIDIEVHGTVLAVSVELTGSKNVVPGSDMVVYDSWGEYYKD